MCFVFNTFFDPRGSDKKNPAIVIRILNPHQKKPTTGAHILIPSHQKKNTRRYYPQPNPQIDVQKTPLIHILIPPVPPPKKKIHPSPPPPTL
jgi:hypothetical protein